MGPDEHPSREELELIVRFMFAKFQQQAEVITALASALAQKGLLTSEQMTNLAAVPSSQKAKEALQKLREYANVQSIARQYLDPPSE